MALISRKSCLKIVSTACVDLSDKGSHHQAWDQNSREHLEFSERAVCLECKITYLTSEASPAGICSKQELSALRTGCVVPLEVPKGASVGMPA